MAACRNFLDRLGWQFTPDLELGSLFIITGRQSNIIVVTLPKDRLFFWQQLISQQEFPTTFSYVTPDDTYHYFFQYEKIPRTFFNDIAVNTDRDLVQAPCHQDTRIIAGFNDGNPIIAKIPIWLRDYIIDQQVDYTKFTVPELKNILRQLGLPVSGRKDVLIQRIKRG